MSIRENIAISIASVQKTGERLYVGTDRDKFLLGVADGLMKAGAAEESLVVDANRIDGDIGPTTAEEPDDVAG